MTLFLHRTEYWSPLEIASSDCSSMTTVLSSLIISANLVNKTSACLPVTNQSINQVFVYLREKTPSDTDAGGMYNRIKK